MSSWCGRQTNFRVCSFLTFGSFKKLGRAKRGYAPTLTTGVAVRRSSSFVFVGSKSCPTTNWRSSFLTRGSATSIRGVSHHTNKGNCQVCLLKFIKCKASTSKEKKTFFATAVFKEWAVAWTVSINWGIVSADEIVSGFLAAMKDGWGRARHHNCMKGLITVERLKLGDDVRFGRVESPDLQTEFERLDECQFQSRNS